MASKQILFSLLLLLLALEPLQAERLELSAQEQAFRAAHPVVRVSNQSDWPPYEFVQDGVATGYTAEYLKLLARIAGLRLAFVQNHQFEVLWNKFCQGEIDILNAIDQKQERHDCGTVLEPPIISETVCFASRADFKPLTGVEDLFGSRVVLYRNIEVSNWFLDEYGEQVTPVFVDSALEGLRAIATYRADVMPELRSVLNYHINRYGLQDLRVSGYLQPLGLYDFSIAVRDDWPLLLSLLRKARKAVTQQEIVQLRERWIAPVQAVTGEITIALNERERALLQAQPVIEVGNQTNYPPFDFAVEDAAQGYSIELIELLARKLGLEIRYVTRQSWQQLLEHFKQGRLDLLHTAAKTPAREDFAHFSEPYFQNRTHFVIAADSEPVNGIADLAGKTVAVGQGWTHEAFLAQHHPEVKRLSCANLEASLQAVADGRAAAGVASLNTLRYALEHRAAADLKLAGRFREFDRAWNSGFHFMTQPAVPEFAGLLNKAMASLTIAERNALESRWLASNAQTNQPPLGLNERERAYLRKKQRLRVCASPAWLPYETLSNGGGHEGIGAEVLTLIAEKLDVPLQVVAAADRRQALANLRQRDCDVLALAAPTPARLDSMDFTRPYIKQPLVVVTRAAELFVAGPQDLVGKRVGIRSACPLCDRLRNQGIELVKVAGIEAGLQKVRTGELYGYIDTPPVIAYRLQQMSSIDLKIAGKLGIDLEMGIASRSDEPLLNTVLEKALASIDEQTLTEIINSWYTVRFEQGFNYTLFWKALSVVAVVLLVTMYWNRRLASAKKQTDQALRELHVVQAELRRLAATDNLTGLYNRSKLDMHFEHELHRAERYGNGLAVILLDVDYFKAVNDNYGHQIGDQVLIQVAAILKAHTRANDIAGRWGGEEFLVLCPQTSCEGAASLAEKLRAHIQAQQFPEVGSKTASFGVTCYRSDDNEDRLVARADAALYKAKAAGRNCVVVG